MKRGFEMNFDDLRAEQLGPKLDASKRALLEEAAHSLRTAAPRPCTGYEGPSECAMQQHMIVHCLRSREGFQPPNSWAKWLRDRILKGDANAIRQLAVFIDALHEKPPRLPALVSLKELGLKRRRGRPKASESPRSVLTLFAAVASDPIYWGTKYGQMPSATYIRKRFNQE